MKKLIKTAETTLGPFNVVEVLPDRFVADGLECQFDVLGVAVADASACVQDAAGYMAPDELLRRAEAVVIAAETKARVVRDALVAGISPAEMASWPIKRAEAIAYQAAGVQATNADAPMLAIEAQARGISVAALAEKVLTKAQALSALEAAIAGRCGAIQDAARAARTLADLESINVQSGWPA